MIAPRLVYLASPYSHPDPFVREERFEAVCKVASVLMRNGVHLYSPIAHTHPIAKYGLPTGWDFWEQYDRVILSRCSDLWLLKLPGWETSIGCEAELQIAHEGGLRIIYLTPEEVLFAPMGWRP